MGAATPETGRSWSWAGRWALVALILTLILLPVSLRAAMLPLAAYALICCLVPFFPQWSWYLPVVSRGDRNVAAVAVTFDDGPDPRTTPALLRLLERHAVKATFFLLGRRAARNPDLVTAIITAGHTIGNHSYSHDSSLMLRSAKRLADDIAATQELLAGHGIRPLAFRPPVGVTNPLLASVVARLGMFTVNFSCRAYDLGNRRLSRMAAKLLGRVRPGDILLLHDAAPPQAEALSVWLSEVDQLLVGLAAKGLEVVPLADLIGREVMGYSEAALRQQRGSKAR